MMTIHNFPSTQKNSCYCFAEGNKKANQRHLERLGHNKSVIWEKNNVPLDDSQRRLIDRCRMACNVGARTIFCVARFLISFRNLQCQIANCAQVVSCNTRVNLYAMLSQNPAPVALKIVRCTEQVCCQRITRVHWLKIVRKNKH